MITKLRQNRINIDLQEYKQPWLLFCKAHGLTPSAAFRQLVAKLTSDGPTAPKLMAQDVISKKVRVELRWT